MESGGTAPIAIVGWACRFPGADDPDAFWHVLEKGIETVSEVPPERWDANSLYDPGRGTVGKMNTRRGGFLRDVDCFDAEFFGISLREARSMDPQQRLLLELAWSALEDAGIVPAQIAGSRTAVFIGASNWDYNKITNTDVAFMDAYSGPGTALSVAANRISYFLDLQGPSITVDTACSSALAAAHLACQSLRSAESDLALVGGVNLVLSPETTIVLSQAGMLAPDGRCKAFDETADGFVRSEGCAVLVCKRYDDAVRDGDRILGVLKGSSVRHNGLTNGLTAPSGAGQKAGLREALDRAGVAPGDVQYAEAHGTGTRLGDSIEVAALEAVLKEGRSSEQPCGLGSVKTNIGHTEAASGIAGLMKVLLSMQHRVIPPHLHLTKVGSYVAKAMEGAPFFIPTTCVPWVSEGRKRIASVGSFGFGGANAHVVLEEAPPSMVSEESGRSAELLTLSARSSSALRDLARAYEAYLATHPDASLADVCFTANTGRTRFPHRLATVARSIEELRAKLRTFAAGEPTDGAFVGHAKARARLKIAFAFLDDAADADMGRRLCESQPVFRRAFERCQRVTQPLLASAAVVASEQAVDDPSGVEALACERAIRFAVAYALGETWKSWGITPASWYGSGVGEHAGACVVDGLDLEQGAKLALALAHPGSTRGAGVPTPSSDVLIEIGGRRGASGVEGAAVSGDGVPSLPSMEAGRDEWQVLLESLGRLFTRGIEANWAGFYAHERRRRIALPTYPFERTRFWVDVENARGHAAVAPACAPSDVTRIDSIGDSADAPSTAFDLIRDAAPAERERLLRVYLQGRIARILKRDLSDVPVDALLIQFGVDSLLSVEVINRLERDLRLALPAKALYERPRIDALAEYLSDQFEQAHKRSPSQREAVLQGPAPAVSQRALPSPARPTKDSAAHEMTETTLHIHGQEICLCAWGHDQAPLIFCIHGIADQGAAWHEVATTLASMGYRVVAPDLRGHGRSSHAGMGDSCSVVAHLADVDAALRRLSNQPVVVVGHSMGACVAGLLASARPQLVRSVVLVEHLLFPEMDPRQVIDCLSEHLDDLASELAPTVYPDVASAAARLREVTPAMSEDLSLRLARRATEPCQAGVRWRWDRLLRSRSGLAINALPFGRSGQLEALRRVRAPVTLVAGDASRFNTALDASEQQAALPHVRSVVLAGGHNLHIDAANHLALVIAEAARHVVASEPHEAGRATREGLAALGDPI